MMTQLDAKEVVACKEMLVDLLSEMGVEKKGPTLQEANDMRKKLSLRYQFRMQEFKHIE